MGVRVYVVGPGDRRLPARVDYCHARKCDCKPRPKEPKQRIRDNGCNGYVVCAAGTISRGSPVLVEPQHERDGYEADRIASGLRNARFTNVTVLPVAEPTPPKPFVDQGAFI